MDLGNNTENGRNIRRHLQTKWTLAGDLYYDWHLLDIVYTKASTNGRALTSTLS